MTTNLNTNNTNNTITFPHSEFINLEKWKEFISQWKKENKNVTTADLLIYLMIKSKNKEVFLNKAKKAFTPIKNQNKLKHQVNGIAYMTALNTLKNMTHVFQQIEKNGIHKYNNAKYYFKHVNSFSIFENAELLNIADNWIKELYQYYYDISFKK